MRHDRQTRKRAGVRTVFLAQQADAEGGVWPAVPCSKIAEHIFSALTIYDPERSKCHIRIMTLRTEALPGAVRDFPLISGRSIARS